MQLLFKRLYNDFAHGLFARMHIFRVKGIFVGYYDQCVRVLDGRRLPLEWVELAVFEKGDMKNLEERKAYFNENYVFHGPGKFLQKII